MMLMVVGCGSNEAEDKSMNDSNQSLSREEQQSDTDGQMPALNEDQAIEIVESQLAASSSDDAESKVHLLREAKLGDELIMSSKESVLGAWSCQPVFCKQPGHRLQQSRRFDAGALCCLR